MAKDPVSGVNLIGSTTAANIPSKASDGAVIFNTDNNQMYAYIEDDNKWVQISPSFNREFWAITYTKLGKLLYG